MARPKDTPGRATLEEATSVPLCLVDDAYRLLNPDGRRRYEFLKKLSDSEALTLAFLHQLRGVGSWRSFLRDAGALLLCAYNTYGLYINGLLGRPQGRFEELWAQSPRNTPNCAKAPKTWKISLPPAVVVSRLSVRLRKPTPRPSNSPTRSISSRSDLPSRSSRATTSTSPSLNRGLWPRRGCPVAPGRQVCRPSSMRGGKKDPQGKG